MPKYIITSDSPIHAREIPGHDPDAEVGGGPIIPERPTLPPDWERPTLPPREEWPPLPPWAQPGVGLPIPPSVEHPMVPVEPEVTDPPEIWPPVRIPPELPDISGKTLALVRVFVSRHVNYLAWVIIDNEEAKAKAKAALEAIKARLPGTMPPMVPPRQPK